MTSLTCVIIKKEWKILIARRAIGQRLPGKREFPGGKVEDGESFEECLDGELKEEFGVKPENFEGFKEPNLSTVTYT